MNHPATRMWRGYEVALARYGMACCAIWKGKGYVDNMWTRFLGARDMLTASGSSLATPDWLDDRDLVRSHQSNLIRKDPDHYAPLFPGVPDDLPYIWPV